MDTIPQADPQPPRQASRPDLAGDHYHAVLAALHRELRPETYFEVGTLHGDTLALAQCRAVAVDPEFAFTSIETVQRLVAKPSLGLFRMGSDAFFARHDLTALLGGEVEMAFLDGMHRCEFLLRDFINTERHCRRNSVVMLHDCLPVEEPMTDRRPHARPALAPHREGWWTGDVWRTALLLKRVRPDLAITALDASPTGLLLVTNLDPSSTVLADGYARHVSAMMGWSLPGMGIDALFEEMGVEQAAEVLQPEALTARFWL